MTHRLDWDDLRYALAVADEGSVAAAARRLGVNHTTVLRRIHAFEETHNIHLFDRLPSGYALTAEGEQLVAAARSIDDTVVTLERRIAGQDLKLEGVIRVTTTDTMMVSVLATHLASFRREHPRIKIELALTNSRLNLTKRDADIAVRPARTPPAPLVGRRVADVAFAIYGSDRYLEANPSQDMKDHVWLAGDETLANAPVAGWMNDHVPEDKIAFCADSFLALAYAAEAGLGLSALPCCLADTMPPLRRFKGPIKELGTGLWLLSHRDLSDAARVRAFMDHVFEGLAADRDRLEGKRSRTSADGCPI